jgi:hypothetical protein
MVGEEVHLVFEGVGGERPTVAEDYGLTGAPVLVVEVSVIFGGEHAHGVFSFIESGPLEDAESGAGVSVELFLLCAGRVFVEQRRKITRRV